MVPGRAVRCEVDLEGVKGKNRSIRSKCIVYMHEMPKELIQIFYENPYGNRRC